MSSPRANPQVPSIEEPSLAGNDPIFPRDFEENLNRELVIASLNVGEPSAGLASPAEGSSSSRDIPTLARGLQIPSKAKSPASGFEYPIILEKLGITQEDWTRFSDEVRSHASMSRKQWRDTIGTAAGTVFVGSLMVGVLSMVPGVIVGKKQRDKKEKENFKAASESGALLECIQRWNKDFFFQRGLAVRVDVPGSASDMARMDLTTSKEYKERSETASLSTQSSAWESGYSDSLIEEGRARQKAAKRGRIVLMPLDESASITADPEQFRVLPEPKD